jgi:hypothetical protein
MSMETHKHFGINWWVDINTSRIRVSIEPERWAEYGEFQWVSVETTYAGGALFVGHDSETGKYHIFEMGGTWIDPWDKEHAGLYESPLDALKAAARILKDDHIEGMKWEVLIDEAMAAAERAEAEAE